MRGGSIYIQGNSGLHKLHPMTKLAFSGLCFACAAALPTLPGLLAVFGLVILPLAVWGRLTKAFVKACLLVVGPFLLSLSIIQGFFHGGETVLFALGRFSYTLEGLMAGLLFAARLLVALGGTLLLMQSTDQAQLMQALTERGFPARIAYVVLTAIQIFPSFQERAQVIMDAQQARGLELQTGALNRARLLLPMVGPLILGSVMNVSERAMALEARGFSSPAPKTSLYALADSSPQRSLRWLLLAAAVALLLWRLWSALA